MFCINICFWSRSRSEPSFYGWSWSRYFLPGAGAETKNIRSRGKLVWLRNTGIAKFYLDIVRVTLELHELGTGPGVPDTQHLLSRPAHYHRPCKQTYRFDTTDKKHSDYNYFFFASGVGSRLCPWVLHYYTMILQRIRIIVGDAGFESGTSAPEAWYRYASNEPPHLPIIIMY